MELIIRHSLNGVSIVEICAVAEMMGKSFTNEGIRCNWNRLRVYYRSNKYTLYIIITSVFSCYLLLLNPYNLRGCLLHTISR